MPKPLFNEHELYLVRQWSNARVLEDAMAALREKHAAIFDRVLEEVQQKHPELDRRDMRTAEDEGFWAGVGKSEWSSKGHWASGLWIGEAGLDDLASEDEAVSSKGILISHPPRVIELQAATRVLCEAAKGILTKVEFRRMERDCHAKYGGVYWPLAESRGELLDMLLCGDARTFIGRMVAHFESMMKFVPVIDGIFKTVARSRR
jgi:hypothetical protein